MVTQHWYSAAISLQTLTLLVTYRYHHLDDENLLEAHDVLCPPIVVRYFAFSLYDIQQVTLAGSSGQCCTPRQVQADLNGDGTDEVLVSIHGTTIQANLYLAHVASACY